VRGDTLLILLKGGEKWGQTFMKEKGGQGGASRLYFVERRGERKIGRS